MAAAGIFGGVALGAAGCVIETAVGRDELDSAEVARVPPAFRHELDLLFVVDATEDMPLVQEHLATMWQRIRGHLEFAEGGFPDVRIGVVSSDLGAGAAASEMTGEMAGELAACTERGDDGALATTADGARWVQVDPAAPAAADLPFARLALLGDGGCPIEQPLAALARALDADQPLNDGFRRDAAALGVVMVGGGDDCSVRSQTFWEPSGDTVDFRCFREGVVCDGDDVSIGAQHGCTPRASSITLADVDAQVELLDRLAPGRRQLAVAAVVGDPERVVVTDAGGQLALAPACTESKTDLQLYPGVRVGAFAARAGGSVTGLCGAEVDTTGALAGLAIGPRLTDAGAAASRDLRRSLGHRCLEGRILDVEPHEPGMQTACEVAAVDALGRETPMEACANPNHVLDVDGPCWAIKAGPAECGDWPSQLAVQVNWGGDDKVTQPADTELVVRCVVEEDASVVD